jgi:hypothetical protein
MALDSAVALLQACMTMHIGITRSCCGKLPVATAPQVLPVPMLPDNHTHAASCKLQNFQD